MTPTDCLARREALGLSRTDLARAAGVDVRTVATFESGAAAARPVTLVALRKAFRRLAGAMAGKGV